MPAATNIDAARVTGLSALRVGYEFARDPLLATRRAFKTWGPLVVLSAGVPFAAGIRAPMLGVPLVLTAGARFNAEVLSDPGTWRGVSVLPGGPKNSAARRMTMGLPRLVGEQHAHYRKLISHPLRRSGVQALTGDIASLVDAEVASWPLDEPIDLWERVGRLMQVLAVTFLFGGDQEASRAIIELAGRMMEQKWGPAAVALPINLPITAYGRIVRQSAELERRILHWAAARRGRADNQDLAAIVVNNPDSEGRTPDNAAIVAHIASMFALSSEGSQSALVWTLLLLTQHPAVASTLAEELQSKLGQADPTLDRAGELPFLDGVIKESMRLLPPVPLQIRVAQRHTTLAGTDLPGGTRVMLNTFLTNRMPDLFPEGDAYRPQRWAGLRPNAFEFPVFSAGPYLCPGYWFGTAAIKVTLAAILARYRLEIPAGTRIDYRAQPTLRPRRRLDVVLHPADGKPNAPPAIGGTIRNLVNLSPAAGLARKL